MPPTYDATVILGRELGTSLNIKAVSCTLHTSEALYEVVFLGGALLE
jgi:hypothetical protein